MAVESGKFPQPLNYSTLPNPRRRTSPRNLIFLIGIWLMYGPVLIVLVLSAILSAFNLIKPGASLAGYQWISDGRATEVVRLILLVGLVVLLTFVFRWAHRKARNHELDY